MGLGIGAALKLGVIGALVLGALFVVWMAFRSARKRGQEEVRFDQAKQSADRAQEAAEIDEDVDSASLDDLVDELRRK